MDELVPTEVYELRGEGKLRSHKQEYPGLSEVDTYTGTYNLSAGVYLVEFDIQVGVEEDELAYLQGVESLQRIGGVLSPRMYSDSQMFLYTNLLALQGLRFDEDVPIAELGRVNF